MVWHIKYQKCTYCRTTLFNHMGKGYCSKCRPILRKIEIITGWDESRKETLKYFQGLKAGYIEIYIKEGLLIKMKNYLITELKNQLHYILQYGQIEEGTLKIDGLQLEYILKQINSVSGSYNKKLFEHDATIFNDMFNTEQMNQYYKLLLLILIYRKRSVEYLPIRKFNEWKNNM